MPRNSSIHSASVWPSEKKWTWWTPLQIEKLTCPWTFKTSESRCHARPQVFHCSVFCQLSGRFGPTALAVRPIATPGLVHLQPAWFYSRGLAGHVSQCSRSWEAGKLFRFKSPSLQVQCADGLGAACRARAQDEKSSRNSPTDSESVVSACRAIRIESVDSGVAKFSKLNIRGAGAFLEHVQGSVDSICVGELGREETRRVLHELTF